MKKNIRIGLFGFGAVGQGLYDVLKKSEGLSASIEKICIKDPTKSRKLPSKYFTTEANEVLEDKSIDLIVELIDDAEAAYTIIKKALILGKSVVSANKKLLAYHQKELIQLQNEYGGSLLYEASSCGGIPIIRTLEEYYDNESLRQISGIFNGSSNYILSQISQKNVGYAAALAEAQEKGFAESDPTLDVGGYDTKYKLCILANHSFGLIVQPEEIFHAGIAHISSLDFKLAKQRKQHIKLVAHGYKLPNHRVALWVLPELIGADHPLYAVEEENNAVVVEGAFSDKQLFLGKGAGGHPTGSAVLSDISATTYDYKYGYKKLNFGTSKKLDNNLAIEVYLRYNSPKVLEHLPFLEVADEEAGRVIGTTTLEALLNAKQVLENDKAFIASTGKISPVKQQKVLTQFRKRVGVH